MKRQMVTIVLLLVLLLQMTAAQGETVKHERIYSIISADGHVSVVANIILENRDKLDIIRDRSSLSEITSAYEETDMEIRDENLVWHTQGRDVKYQGIGEKIPRTVPNVIFTSLSGDRLTPKDAAGQDECMLHVSFDRTEQAPMFIICAVPLPEIAEVLQTNGCADLVLAEYHVLLGLTLTGVENQEGETDGFTCKLRLNGKLPEALYAFASASVTNLLFSNINRELNKITNVTDDLKTVVYGIEKSEDAPAARTEILQALGEIVTNAMETARNSLSEKEEKKTAPANDAMSINTVTGPAPDAPAEREKEAEQLVSTHNDLKSGNDTLVNDSKKVLSGISYLIQRLNDMKTREKLLNRGTNNLQEKTSAAKEDSETISKDLQKASDDGVSLQHNALELLNAMLETANRRLSAFPFHEIGLELPVLTRDNYQEVLTDLTAHLAPDDIQSNIESYYLSQIRKSVESRRGDIAESVRMHIKDRTLDLILLSQGFELSHEDYAAACQAGKVDEATIGEIERQLEEKMHDEDILAVIDEQTDGQIDVEVKEQFQKQDTQMSIQETVRTWTSDTVQSSLKDELIHLSLAASLVENTRVYAEAVPQWLTDANELCTALTNAEAESAKLIETVKDYGTHEDALIRDMTLIREKVRGHVASSLAHQHDMALFSQSLADVPERVRASLAADTDHVEPEEPDIQQDVTGTADDMFRVFWKSFAEMAIPFLENDFSALIHPYTLSDAGTGYDLLGADMVGDTAYIYRVELE